MIKDFSFKVSMSAEWSHIEAMRLSIEQHLRLFEINGEFASSVAMVSAELLENAVKYSDHPAASRQESPIIHFRLHGNQSAIVLTVRNPVADEDGNVEALIKRLQRISDLGDPAEAYAECIQDVFDGKVDEGGLGLAWVVYEAGCRLSYEPESGHVKIRATFSMPDKKDAETEAAFAGS